MHSLLRTVWWRFRRLPPSQRHHTIVALLLMGVILPAAHYGGSYPMERWGRLDWVIIVLMAAMLAHTVYDLAREPSAEAPPATPETDRFFRTRIYPLVGVAVALGFCLGYLFAKL